MKSIKLSFTRASTDKPGFSTFWFLALALIILNDDADAREKKRRKKRNRQANKPPRKPPSGPKPF